MLNELVEKHATTLAKAQEANSSRQFHAHWPEIPSGKIYGETAQADGERAFTSSLQSRFDRLISQNASEWLGSEDSPYGFSLGITYPAFEPEVLFQNARTAWEAWKNASARLRASVLIEALERASKHFFEIGFATQHTTGQGFMMSFQASGPHAFDRALEAIAAGVTELEHISPDVTWTKPMGKMSVTLDKKFYAVPKGIGVVIGCSTFPVWNTLPGVFANLITGNPVIIKPHPKAILPIAIVVASLQQTFRELGFSPFLVQLAVDTAENPITLDLVEFEAVKLIDFTGGSVFGDQLEATAARLGKTIFAEKSGVNSVLLESVHNLDAVLENIAFSICLYSSQMCTAPQNVFINKNGVREGEKTISYEEVVERFIKAIDALAGNEKIGPGTLGAIQSPATLARISEAKALGLPIVRDSAVVAHPGFDGSRGASPLVLKAEPEQYKFYEREFFGPIVFIIPTDSFDHGLQLMLRGVRTEGALTTLVHTVDETQIAEAEQKIVFAGAPVAFNFVGPIWVNQSAAFSDFHGAGANPAGNATYTDAHFITGRFNCIGSRRIA